MKHIKLYMTALVCITAMLFSVAVCATDEPAVLTYTYTDDTPIVSVTDCFMPIYEGEHDIRIVGTRATWHFFYENISRSTDKWRDFSTKINVAPITGEAHDSNFVSAATGGYSVRFRAGDVYPGTAQMTVKLDDILAENASKPLSVYVWQTDGEGINKLRSVVENIKLDGEGCLSLALTEAHDLLVIPTENVTDALNAYLYTPAVADTGGFFGGASLFSILFFAVVGVVIVLGILYYVTVKIIKRKRHQK